ncbi:MAG: GAF domain-containing sensor histidine kinase [Anaerolineaceae bacterium]|nr:GAF domain-containing sensor histidine kinase [Anaerolineaceae bacterium]MBN2676750.1 GAF domain-containing sensor histidine kinase [Anaerolineaceae bacterium]
MIIPVTQAPTDQWLEEATQLIQIFNHSQDWHNSINQSISLIRKLVIFDNFVIYHPAPSSPNLQLLYARATGRGRSQGAEITWGEPFARRVISAQSCLLEQTDPGVNVTDRLEKPIMLGVPLTADKSLLGILVFIRFGSPAFDDQQVLVARWIAEQISALLRCQNLKIRAEIAEEKRKQAEFQEDFLSTITHELRTPLGFIKGYTTTLMRDDTKWDKKSQHDFLAIIDQETDILQDLIENILDTAHLQSGTMPITFLKIRVEPIINDVKSRIQTQHPDCLIDCQFQTDTPTIMGDARRLAQVFENLIINAIKYAPKATITIQTRRRLKGITIVIRDDGPGIPKEEMSHIFERFYRGSTAHSQHGSGLGLYICRQIIRSHHGRIKVASEPGKGTRFIIHLPLIQPGIQEDE